VNKKGAISYMLEIYFGVIIIFFIMVSSFYFAEQSEIKAEADVIAVSTGFECHNNINNIMKMNHIFGQRTSITIANSEQLSADLTTLSNELDKMISKNHTLRTYKICDSLKEGCGGTPDETISVGRMKGNLDKCVYAIPQADCEGEYCNIFIELEVEES
tara:strand:- start:6368 stop:6844 length:477 start_codon:yes stop_codon:yes gene_type:complete